MKVKKKIQNYDNEEMLFNISIILIFFFLLVVSNDNDNKS